MTTRKRQKPTIRPRIPKPANAENKKKPADPDNKRHKEDFEQLLDDAALKLGTK